MRNSDFKANINKRLQTISQMLDTQIASSENADKLQKSRLLNRDANDKEQTRTENTSSAKVINALRNGISYDNLVAKEKQKRRSHTHKERVLEDELDGRKREKMRQLKLERMRQNTNYIGR